MNWFNRKIGGITGDVIVCINELVEILTLVLIPVLAGAQYASYRDVFAGV